MGKIRRGSYEWTEKRLVERWKAICRLREYRSFCDNHPECFNDMGMWEGCCADPQVDVEAERIREKFALDIIYHYNTPLEEMDDGEGFINSCVFERPFAVEIIEPEQNSKSDDFDPIIDKNFILLKVNIEGSLTIGQIKEEVAELVEWARKIADIKASGRRSDSTPDKYELHIYELVQKGRSKIEIAREMWPSEWPSNSTCSETDADNLYGRLSIKYRNAGYSDWDEKAYHEAYTDDPLNPTEHLNSTQSKKALWERVNSAYRKVERFLESINRM